MMIVLAAGIVSAADVAGWDSFVIRNATTGGAAPAINDILYLGQPAKGFVTNAGGMKAAWGTNNINGYKMNQITELTIDRLNPEAPQINAPYFNIWITDGAGHFAVIANEPSNPEWAGDSEWNITSWNMLSSKTAKIYENSDLSWLPAKTHTIAGFSGLQWIFEDFAGFTIQAPTAAQLTASWTGLGTGAPRELGTNVAYGFNWMFGDTLANYVSDGYVVANPTAVPEPATMALLGLGALLCRKFRKA